MEILDKYGDWRVIDRNFILRKKHKYIKCKCKCGYEKYIMLSSLKAKQSKMCQSCAGKSHPMPKAFMKIWEGKVIKGLNRTTFGHIKSKATERSLEFNVSQQFLADLFEKQNGKCALTGITITLSTIIKRGNPDWNYITASLDRIDSSRGYTEDNVQWVHKDINKMKMAYNNKYFIDMCILVAKNQDNTELSQVGTFGKRND